MESDLETPTTAVSPRLAALRDRIALICYAIRWLTFGYALFVLWGIFDGWLDHPRMERYFTGVYKLDISGASQSQWALGMAVALLGWLVLAALCWNVWRLFGCYIAGDIFSRGSAVLLQRIGFLGLTTVAVDFALRPVTVHIMGVHLADRTGARHGFIRSEDVLYVLISLVFVALGATYRSAAEIADENAQIV
jgi:hypothetical protein